MVEAFDSDSARTDRPGRLAADESLPTVREVLAMDGLADGMPEVLVGGDALNARVRWVHVSDSPGVARLLDGGELLLSTGAGWPSDAGEQRELIAALRDAGLTGLVLELGTPLPEVPPAIVEAAQERGLALVALHSEIKFVTVTEAVHSRIISEQMVALRARDEVRARFTSLALRGAPADYIVQQLAQTLAAPVILENLAHDVVAADVPPSLEEDLFTRWEYRSRLAHRQARQRQERSEPPTADDWLIVPVEARGIRWGNLVVLPGPAHPAGRTSVLEQGAIALAVGRLADGETDEWARLGRKRLLDDLLAGRYVGTAGAAARLAAAGVPVEGRRLYGLVIAGAPVTAQTVDAAVAPMRAAALVGSAPARVPSPAAVVLLSLPAGRAFDDDAATVFARTAGGDRAVLSVGSAAEGLEAALQSLQEAVDLARGRVWRDSRGLRWAEARPLVKLVTSLRDDHRVLEHGERMLAPLIEYDLARGGDLLDVLGAMLAHPSNRTAAASASHLSRSVFYQRIALIEQLLGADLDDGETQAALHLALLIRRSAGR